MKKQNTILLKKNDFCDLLNFEIYPFIIFIEFGFGLLQFKRFYEISTFYSNSKQVKFKLFHTI